MENEFVGFLQIFHPGSGHLWGYRAWSSLSSGWNTLIEYFLRASVHCGVAWAHAPDCPSPSRCGTYNVQKARFSRFLNFECCQNARNSTAFIYMETFCSKTLNVPREQKESNNTTATPHTKPPLHFFFLHHVCHQEPPHHRPVRRGWHAHGCTKGTPGGQHTKYHDSSNLESLIFRLVAIKTRREVKRMLFVYSLSHQPAHASSSRGRAKQSNLVRSLQLSTERSISLCPSPMSHSCTHSALCPVSLTHSLCSLCAPSSFSLK